MTESEQHRHECEVRYIVSMYENEGGDAVKAQITLVEKNRGAVAAQKLRRDALRALGR